MEKGNHRIQVLRVFNIQAPVVVELAETTVGNLGNGAHLYSIDAALLKDHVRDLPPVNTCQVRFLMLCNRCAEIHIT